MWLLTERFVVAAVDWIWRHCHTCGAETSNSYSLKWLLAN